MSKRKRKVIIIAAVLGVYLISYAVLSFCGGYRLIMFGRPNPPGLGISADSILCLLSFRLWNWQPENHCADHADIFIRVHPCHPWFNSLRRGTAGRHD